MTKSFLNTDKYKLLLKSNGKYINNLNNNTDAAEGNCLKSLRYQTDTFRTRLIQPHFSIFSKSTGKGNKKMRTASSS